MGGYFLNSLLSDIDSLKLYAGVHRKVFRYHRLLSKRSLNPMVGVIDGFRWALLRGESALWWPSLLTSVALTFVLCLSGVWYFRKMERTFADVI